MSDIAEFCGFSSNWDMLKYHWTNEELMDLLCEYVSEDKDGWIHEIVEGIASEVYEYVDWDRVREDADDAKMQEWKDNRGYGSDE
tara:strand:+ start:66 stop:320 length:255 start_codon:yes stop_codon:yes gene_type:complete